MTPDEFRAETGVSRETTARFSTYERLLRKWQARINLIGKSTLADIWRRHFFDSAQLYDLLPQPYSATRPTVIADLGSGAGFPGLVLALIAAGDGRAVTVHLIESDSRKAAFLIEAVGELDLVQSVVVHNRRVESLGSDMRRQVDVVTARALADVARLLDWSAPLLRTDGVCIFLKGTSASDELTKSHKVWKMRTEMLPSRSDPSGIILRLGDLGRV